MGGRRSLRRFRFVFEFAMMPAQEALGQDFAAVPVLVLFRRHAEGAGKSEATVASIVAIVHTFFGYGRSAAVVSSQRRYQCVYGIWTCSDQIVGWDLS